MVSARKAKHFDATTMFEYCHANTPLGQSERTYYLGYFTTAALGADHLTLEGAAGVGGDFEKKIPASACRKKKIACSTNVIEKNSCAAVRKKKKCCKAISSFREALQNRSKTATIL